MDTIDYSIDSEEDWEDEGSGEELNSANDASDEDMNDIDSDADEKVNNNFQFTLLLRTNGWCHMDISQITKVT